MSGYADSGRPVPCIRRHVVSDAFDGGHQLPGTVELLREDLREGVEVSGDVGRYVEGEIGKPDGVEGIEPVELDRVEDAERLEHGPCPSTVAQPIERVQGYLETEVVHPEEVRIPTRFRVTLDHHDPVPGPLEVAGR